MHSPPFLGVHLSYRLRVCQWTNSWSRSGPPDAAVRLKGLEVTPKAMAKYIKNDFTGFGDSRSSVPASSPPPAYSILCNYCRYLLAAGFVLDHSVHLLWQEKAGANTYTHPVTGEMKRYQINPPRSRSGCFTTRLRYIGISKSPYFVDLGVEGSWPIQCSFVDGQV